MAIESLQAAKEFYINYLQEKTPPHAPYTINLVPAEGFPPKEQIRQFLSNQFNIHDEAFLIWLKYHVFYGNKTESVQLPDCEFDVTMEISNIRGNPNAALCSVTGAMFFNTNYIGSESLRCSYPFNDFCGKYGIYSRFKASQSAALTILRNKLLTALPKYL